MPAPLDSVDRMVDEWKLERPDLDITPSAVVIRISILAHAFQIELKRFFAENGLSKADFEVLAALRRSGSPYALSQHEIVHVARRSSGTVSFRIDRLESGGFVRRIPDPADARSVIVELSEKGKRLVDRIAPAHLANESRLLSALSKREQTELATLLRKLVLHNSG
jgi:DNA-binding MarR family transcriptional regulator